MRDRGGPTGEPDGSLYWDLVEPSWANGWQGWVDCCCDSLLHSGTLQRGGKTSAWVHADTHKSHLQQGLRLLVEV